MRINNLLQPIPLKTCAICERPLEFEGPGFRLEWPEDYCGPCLFDMILEGHREMLKRELGELGEDEEICQPPRIN